MEIRLVVVGKTDDSHITDLINRYRERLCHYIKFEIVLIPAIKNTKSLSSDLQKEKEGKQILKHLNPSDRLVLLDEIGKSYSSIKFAKYLQEHMNTSCRRLVFIIGGSYGFSSLVRETISNQVSLSEMTFSHQMVRLFFVEQLYRAFTILKGEPYHHKG